MVYLIYIFNDPAVLELGVSTGAAALQWEKMRIESTNFGEMKRQVVVGDLVGFPSWWIFRLINQCFLDFW